MKYFCLLFAAAAAVFSLAADEIIWKGDALAGWKALRNVKTSYAEGILKLTDIQRDSQISSPVLKLYPRKYSHVSITYRAEEAPASSGELFFRRGKERMTFQFWRLPALKADGKWHTLTVSSRELNDSKLWFTAEPVTSLRLDITNAPGGTIEVKEIKLFSPAKTAVSRKAAANTLQGEEKWPDVKPEFAPLKYRSRSKNYFQGKMIKSPADTFSTSSPGKYVLRREFTLKKKPAEAFLQFTADDKAEAFLNGKHLKTCRNWRFPVWTDASKYITAGKNVLSFTYYNSRSAGGVLAELYLKYADGSIERINTDGKFTALVSGKKEQKVIVQPCPPHAPWLRFLEYRNFEKPQHLISSKLLTKKAVGGELAKLRFDFCGSIPAAPFEADILLLGDGTELVCETVKLTSADVKTTGKDTWKIEFDYRLPEYSDSRKMTLFFSSGAYFCRTGGRTYLEFPMQRRKVARGYEKAPAVKVVNTNGTPVIQLNGKPFYPLWGAVSHFSRPDRMPRHSGAPLNVVTVYPPWDWFAGIGKINTSHFDRLAESCRRSAPDAWFIWDLTFFLPADWAKKYPGELCLDNKGEVNRYSRYACYSYASEQARKDMKDVLVKAIKYLESSPYANRIIGYRINSGDTIEWLAWAPRNGRFLDYSPAAQKGFREFAAKYYPELKNPTVPTPEERVLAPGKEVLWDQKKNLNAIAYHDYYSNAVVDTMLPLLKETRKLVGSKLLCTFYGYTMTLHGRGTSQMRGHYALKKLLDARLVDILLSPQAYRLRQPGEAITDMKPFTTMQSHNIIAAIEDDTRTHMGEKPVRFLAHTLTKQQTIDAMRRNLSIALCRNQPAYTYSLENNGTGFDFPEMSELLSVVGTAGQFTCGKAKRDARIAYVVSEENIKALPVLNNHYESGRKFEQRYNINGKPMRISITPARLAGHSFWHNYSTLARMGSPCDYLLAEDLKDHPGNYKIYIFVNQFKYDAKFLEAVQKLRQRDCLLVWLHAPGYLSSTENSTAGMKRLTGLDLRKMPGKPLRFAMVPGKGVTVWKKAKDGSVLLGAKKTGKALSVFSSSDDLELSFLRQLAQKAKIHVYSNSTDPMEANSSLVALHARFSGRKEIRLPRRTHVLDVFNKKIIARNADRFTFTTPLHASWLFYYGDDAEILLKELQNSK